VRSVPDAIGKLLQEHYVNPDRPERPKSLKASAGNAHGADIAVALGTPLAHGEVISAGEICPDCQNATLMNEEGCRKCHTCGYSEC
jgi:ribonucleoside-diphosphate reductase alpha chain